MLKVGWFMNGLFSFSHANLIVHDWKNEKLKSNGALKVLSIFQSGFNHCAVGKSIEIIFEWKFLYCYQIIWAIYPLNWLFYGSFSSFSAGCLFDTSWEEHYIQEMQKWEDLTLAEQITEFTDCQSSQPVSPRYSGQK